MRLPTRLSLAATFLALGGLAPAASAAPTETTDTPTVMIQVASPDLADAVASRHGLTVKRGFPWIEWYELATPTGTTDTSATEAELAADSDVKNTDALTKGETFAPQFTPRDTAWTGGLLPTGEQLEWHLAKSNFPAAWDKSTGKGATIGIADSEFDITHDELAPKVRNPYNTSSGSAAYHTGDVKAESSAQLHGTHVAGIAAAVTDNGKGVSGAGFDATFVPVKINTSFTPGTGNPVDGNFVSDLTEALGYLAQQNVSVINLSLGGTRPHPPLAAAIAAVRAAGVPIVVAAGNFQGSSPNAAIYPASYPGVIAVGNVMANDQIAPSSSNGSWVDISAPGTNILSTWDNRDTGNPSVGQFNGEKGLYNSISGTSMASPVVAGAVALMKSARPDLTPDEVENILKGTARDLGSAGQDPQFGFGELDANAAVAAAIAYVRPAPPAPAAPAPPPADLTAPGVKLDSLATVKGKKVTVRFTCTENCTGKVRIKTSGGKRLGTGTFNGVAGKRIVVKVTTSKAIKANTKVKVEIAAADTAGNLATTTIKRTLRK